MKVKNENKYVESEFREAVKQSSSLRDICRFYNKPINGYYTKLFMNWINEAGYDISHFHSGKTIIKCRGCGLEFRTVNSKSNRKFCSLKCANQKVRGNALPKNDIDLIGTYKHRTICFRYHKEECVVCKENIAVTVHHYNEDHNDNRPENLVPICANHHIYLHSNKGKMLVTDIVDNYVKQFKESRAK